MKGLRRILLSVFPLLAALSPFSATAHSSSPTPSAGICRRLLENFGRVLDRSNPWDAQFLDRFQRSMELRHGFPVFTEHGPLMKFLGDRAETITRDHYAREFEGIPASVVEMLKGDTFSQARTSVQDPFGPGSKTHAYVSRGDGWDHMAFRPSSLNVAVILHERFHVKQVDNPHWNSANQVLFTDLAQTLATHSEHPQVWMSLDSRDLRAYYTLASETETIAYTLNMWAYLRKRAGGKALFFDEVAQIPGQPPIAGRLWGNAEPPLDYFYSNVERFAQSADNLDAHFQKLQAIDSIYQRLSRKSETQGLTPFEAAELDAAAGIRHLRLINELYGLNEATLRQFMRFYPYKKQELAQLVNDQVMPTFIDRSIDDNNKLPMYVLRDLIPELYREAIIQGVFHEGYPIILQLSEVIEFRKD